VPRDLPPAELTPETVEEVLRQKREGPEIVGSHPESGEPILLLSGQYGPYVQLGQVVEGGPKPKRASLPKGTAPENVTLEMAVGLLALPRELGEHPETGARVLASQGRFGPYIVHDQGAAGKDYRSLKGEDQVLTITLERALELLAQPKVRRGRRGAEPLRELGPHPADGQPVNLFDGRYGPYVKHGDVSASLPRDRDPAQATLAEAVAWLEARGGARAAARPKKKARAASSSAAKPARTPPKPHEASAAPKARASRARKSPDPMTSKVVKAKKKKSTAKRPSKTAKK
jgi:DNA topoisomerase-1